MKLAKILERATDVIVALGVGKRRTDTHLQKLDFAVLEVAFMIAALDGDILPGEVEAFRRLCRKCRGYSAANEEKALDRALHAAGYLMAMARVDTITPERRVCAFVDAAVAAMPSGFVGGAPADVRRAFAMWVAMGLSDGDYSAIEREAIAALVARFAEIRTAEAGASALAWAAAYPSYGTAGIPVAARVLPKTMKLLEEDFLARAETLIRRLSADATREKAERDLAILICGANAVSSVRS